MKKAFFITIALFAFQAVFAQINFEKTGEIRKVLLTVKVLGPELVALVDEAHEGKQYTGGLLPEELQKNGLKLLLSGDVGKIPMNVRMIGVPFRPTKIKVSKAIQRQYKLTKRVWCL